MQKRKARRNASHGNANWTERGGGADAHCQFGKGGWQGGAIKIPKQRQMNILFFWLQKMQNSWKALEMPRGAEDGREEEWVEREKRWWRGRLLPPVGLSVTMIVELKQDKTFQEPQINFITISRWDVAPLKVKCGHDSGQATLPSCCCCCFSYCYCCCYLPLIVCQSGR